MALGPLEVVDDALQSLVESPLDIRERVRERLSGPSFAFGEGRTPLLSEATLLRGELGDRVGPLAGERAADLLRVRRRLLVDGRATCARASATSASVAVARLRARRSASQRPIASGERGDEAGDENPDEHAGTL